MGSFLKAAIAAVVLVVVLSGCNDSHNRNALLYERNDAYDYLDRRVDLTVRSLDSTRATRAHLAAVGLPRTSGILADVDAILLAAEVGRNLLLVQRQNVGQIQSQDEAQAVRETADDLTDAVQCALRTVNVSVGLIVDRRTNGTQIDRLFCAEQVRHDHPLWPGGPAAQMPAQREILLQRQLELAEGTVSYLYEAYLLPAEQP